MSVEEIFPGVYDITCLVAEGNNRYRAYLFDDDVPTLVDCARRDTVEALLKGIEESGLTPGRLIITHGDGDHVGAFDALVDTYDVETWVPVESDFPSEHTPDHRYQEGEQIGRFQTIYLPGHKDDNYGKYSYENTVDNITNFDTVINNIINEDDYYIVKGKGKNNTVINPSLKAAINTMKSKIEDKKNGYHKHILFVKEEKNKSDKEMKQIEENIVKNIKLRNKINQKL